MNVPGRERETGQSSNWPGAGTGGEENGTCNPQRWLCWAGALCWGSVPHPTAQHLPAPIPAPVCGAARGSARCRLRNRAAAQPRGTPPRLAVPGQSQLLGADTFLSISAAGGRRGSGMGTSGSASLPSGTGLPPPGSGSSEQRQQGSRPFLALAPTPNPRPPGTRSAAGCSLVVPSVSYGAHLQPAPFSRLGPSSRSGSRERGGCEGVMGSGMGGGGNCPAGGSRTLGAGMLGAPRGLGAELGAERATGGCMAWPGGEMGRVLGWGWDCGAVLGGLWGSSETMG